MSHSHPTHPAAGSAGLPSSSGAWAEHPSMEAAELDSTARESVARDNAVSGAGVESQPVQQALAQLQATAMALEGQPEALLALLRSLEQLHRAIQDGPFRASLPADRNALFRLLSEMERSGGWPYIPRLQLRTFLDLLGQGGAEEDLQEPGGGPQQALSDAPRLAA